jgi:hypothetical protein
VRITRRSFVTPFDRRPGLTAVDTGSLSLDSAELCDDSFGLLLLLFQPDGVCCGLPADGAHQTRGNSCIGDMSGKCHRPVTLDRSVCHSCYLLYRKRNAIYLNIWSKMKVGLAMQVVNDTLISALETQVGTSNNPNDSNDLNNSNDPNTTNNPNKPNNS